MFHFFLCAEAGNRNFILGGEWNDPGKDLRCVRPN
jgi:hypothetical protein